VVAQAPGPAISVWPLGGLDQGQNPTALAATRIIEMVILQFPRTLEAPKWQKRDLSLWFIF
jgi:hypothetical protein